MFVNERESGSKTWVTHLLLYQNGGMLSFSCQATSPTADCPACLFHTTKILLRTQPQWRGSGGIGKPISQLKYKAFDFNAQIYYFLNVTWILFQTLGFERNSCGFYLDRYQILIFALFLLITTIIGYICQYIRFLPYLAMYFVTFGHKFGYFWT